MRIETAAAYANVLALVPATYSAYGAWVLLHSSQSASQGQVSSGTLQVNSHAVLVSFFMAAGLVVFAAVVNFVSSFRRRSNNPPVIADTQYGGFRNPRWQIINHHRFENELIDVDGKSFHGCSFKNVTFLFHGNAPTEFKGNSEFESIILSTDHPPTMFWRTLEHIFSTIPGAKLETYPIDKSGHKVERKATLAGTNDKAAVVLASLPVYHQHFDIELLEICHGVTLHFSSWYLFLRVRLFSRENVGIRSIKVFVTTSLGIQESKQLTDLHQWSLRNDRTACELASLWEELERAPLTSGEPEYGWFCYEMLARQNGREALSEASLIKLKIEDGKGRTQVFPFRPPWPRGESHIVDKSLQ